MDLAGLSFPELTEARDRLLDALVRTSGRSDALTLLGAPPAAAAQVAANRRLRSLPTRPALETYRGVLYDALDAPSLSAAGRRRAAVVVVVSALWGVLRPRDRIPPYRLSAGSRLEGVPALTAVWREVVPAALASAAGSRGLVVDLRSSGYLALGRPASPAGRTVQVGVVRDGPPGARW